MVAAHAAAARRSLSGAAFDSVGASASTPWQEKEHWENQMAIDFLEETSPMMSKKDVAALERARAASFAALRAEAEAAGMGFELMSAAVAERLPVIMPDWQEWEVRMEELKQQRRLRDKKQYPMEEFTIPQAQKTVRKDELWAYELMSMGTGDRIGQLAYDSKLRDTVEALRASGADDAAAAEAVAAVVAEAKAAEAATDGGDDNDEAERREETLSAISEMDSKFRVIMEEERARQEAAGTLGGQAGDAADPNAGLTAADIEDGHDFSEIGDLDGLDLGDLVADDQADSLDWGLAMEDDSVAGRQNAADYRPEPRITAEDRSNDVRSLRRRLQRRTHLVVQVRDPAGGAAADADAPLVWRFPTGLRADGEPMYAAAQRHTTALFGEDLELFYLTKWASGYTYVRYSPEVQKQRGVFGAQVFFYRCQRITGNIEEHADDIVDYAWISSDEVHGYLDPGCASLAEDPYWRYASLFMDD